MKQIFLILSLLCTINLYTFSQCDNAKDYTVLYTLYNSTGGDNWTDNTNWDVSAVPPNVPANLDMSTWFGITCEGDRVTSVILGSNNLVGSIPPILGNLTALEHLRLSTNQLTGSIPSSLGNLGNLQKLYLYSNQLSGSIPSSLGNLGNLVILSLSLNQLSGSIPVELGNLGNLESLSLSNNQLSGNIPSILGNLGNLQGLYLSNNQLSGSIPSTLGNLGNLESIGLAFNQLSGNIPSTLGNLGNLESIGLAFNQLSGNIPSTLGNLGNLQYLYLHSNQLSGSIPSTLGNLGNLQYLQLHSNQLSGSIPSTLGNLGNLQWLFLHSNQLSGSIPSSLGNLSNLQRLSLLNNQLSGSIPVSFNQLSQLTVFRLHHNLLFGCYDPALKDGASVLCNFSNSDISDGNNFDANWEDFCANDEGVCGGACNNADDYAALYALYNSTDGDNWNNNTNWDVSTVPPNVPANLDMSTWYGITCEGGRVTKVFLGSNNLVGSIPSELGNLTNLEWLSLYINQLTGSIPSELGNLTNLKRLFISDTQLTGSIPSELGNLTNLEWLILAESQLTGSIPPELGNLTNLEQLILLDNQLTGSIPVSLNQLSQLTVFVLRDNQLSGCYDPALKDGASVLCNFSNSDISNGNNFDANWEDFCANDEGVCPAACNNADDYAALYALYNSTDGDNWTNNTNWDVSAVPPNLPANLDMSIWDGITCEGGRVTEVFLGANNLIGTIPPELGNLDNLEILYLSTNHLSGSIPSELESLGNLKYLILSDNLLTGSIPSTLGNLSNLTNLSLAINQLAGSIPPSLGNLSNLEELDLDKNLLTGSIPSELGNLGSLMYLYLDDNQLTGSIPSILGNLGNLRSLYLDINQLSGTIPVSFNQLSQLIHFSIGDNQLSGCYDSALKDGASVLCDFSNSDVSNGNSFDANWEDFCANDAGSCCGFNPSNWVEGELAEYIIIATEDLEMTKSTVFEGGVAVIDASEVDIEDNTDIQTFLTSAEANIDGTSTVAEYIDANPNLQLPPFMSNTFYDGNNVTVTNGQTVTLSGNHYGYITVMNGGTLNFDNPNVFVQNITTKSQAKINFLQASHIMVRRRVNIGMLNIINENDEDVVIYVGDSFKVSQGTVVNAGVYAQDKIKVNDSGSSLTTQMYGVFISNDEVSSQDNVIWAWSPMCVELENQNLQQLLNLGEVEIAATSKNITLYPNPTSGNFTIATETFMHQKVDIKIYNALGQTVWQLHLDDFEDPVISVDLSGSQFENGVYYISIMTGDIVETKSLVLNKK